MWKGVGHFVCVCMCVEGDEGHLCVWKVVKDICVCVCVEGGEGHLCMCVEGGEGHLCVCGRW